MFSGGILSLRQRSVWEAADAGLLLWRNNLGYFIPLFAIPFWITAFALRFLPQLLETTTSSLPISWLILWWLSPLFDRFILHVVGVRFFEPQSNLRRLFRGLGKDLFRGLAGDLLWRRLSPWRAVMMPLRVLEAPGKLNRLRDRKRALANGGIHFCIFLTVWCFALSWILLAGEAVFVLMISRLFFGVGIWGIGQLFAGKGLYYFTAWCVNYLLVESLYVCMGFGIYLNSRVDVEGWDLELLFRNFSERKKKNSIVVVILFILGLGLLQPAAARAQETSVDLPSAIGAAAPRESLEKILAEDMGSEKKTWGVRFKKSTENEESSQPYFFTPRWIRFLQKAGSFALRALLVLAIGALAIFSGLHAYRHRAQGRGEETGPSMGTAPPPSPEPEQLLGEADRLYRQGLLREAWGLCYTASLGALSRYRGIRFPPGATEYRCLTLVRQKSNGDVGSAFGSLIRHWIGFAYGAQVPPTGSFEEALAWVTALCPPAGERRE